MRYVVWCLKDRKGRIDDSPYHGYWRPEDINKAYKEAEYILSSNEKYGFKYELEIREWNQ